MFASRYFLIVLLFLIVACNSDAVDGRRSDWDALLTDPRCTRTYCAQHNHSPGCRLVALQEVKRDALNLLKEGIPGAIIASKMDLKFREECLYPDSNHNFQLLSWAMSYPSLVDDKFITGFN